MSYTNTHKRLLAVCLYITRAHQHTETAYMNMAYVSRIDKIIGLFCKRDLQKRLYCTKETYSFIDPTDCSHPIPALSGAI